MTKEEIESLLKSSIVDAIETSVVTECNTYVNKEHLNFTIGIIQRQIANSGLSIYSIEEILRTKGNSIIKLGKGILKENVRKRLVEEYPRGEEPSNCERSVLLSSNGIGMGFSINYAIYLRFLENQQHVELQNYLKKERIPKASKFAKTLEQLYRQ